MLTLFEPQLKVQKNRQIIRQTDARMAKYSRRGIVSNILIYILCLIFEPDFYRAHPHLTMVLTSGLMLTALLRGYLLFRFDTVYPRAPAAWRNRYFFITLVGACWWALILGSFTLTLDLSGMSPLLWLYTVVFFSITANAFAPFQKFLSIYQFIGIVPAAACTFFIGELTGVFYGLILVMFYWTLNHHCELISKSYWEQLEAAYSLSHRADTLEEEKRDTRASVALNQEFIALLDERMQKLTESITPDAPSASRANELAEIRDYVHDFRRVLHKDLDAAPAAFNAYHYLRFLTGEQMEEAERKGIELETAFSPALPVHLIGEVSRLGQIIEAMIKSVLAQSSEGLVFVETDYLREFGNHGELQVSLIRQLPLVKRGFFGEQSGLPIQPGLDLIVAKGLAESMGGDLEIGSHEIREGRWLRLRLQMEVAKGSPELDYSNPPFKGRSVLLVHPYARWLDSRRLELGILGFNVETCTDFKRAVKLLVASLDTGKLIESVVYCATPVDEAASQFCNELLDHNELKYTHHFVITSPMAQKYFSDRMVRESPLVHFVDKPAGIFELQIAMRCVSDLEPARSATPQGTVSILWIAIGKAFNAPAISESQAISITRLGDMKQLPRYLEEKTYDRYIIEYTGIQDLGSISAIKNSELEKGVERVNPIVGMGPAAAQRAMLEAGVDHFIEIEKLVNDTRDLRYWLDA